MSVQLVAPAVEVVPVGQLKHAMLAAAPAYVPAGHGVQAVEPGTRANVPAGHAEQLVAPEDALMKPGLQGVQPVAFVAVEYIPLGQARHAPLEANVPAAQLVGLATHAVEPLAPAV